MLAIQVTVPLRRKRSLIDVSLKGSIWLTPVISHREPNLKTGSEQRQGNYRRVAVVVDKAHASLPRCACDLFG